MDNIHYVICHGEFFHLVLAKLKPEDYTRILLLPKYLTFAEVADRCGVNTKLVEEWIKDEILPKMTLGRSPRVSSFKLEELLRNDQLNYLASEKTPKNKK